MSPKSPKRPAPRQGRPARKGGRSRQTRPSTPRQTAILTFVRDYIHKNGYSPTYDEIAAEFDISKVTVFEHLSILESRGLVRRDRHKARSLRLADHLELPDERPGCLPMVGRIAAGAPIEAVENREIVDLDSIFSSQHGVYALEVKGDSMIDDHIMEGDYVVVERRTTPYNGETVVALLEDGEATLKRFYREKDRVRLQPANPRYEPIFVESVNIQGIVIGVIRRTG
jgi:repressor LexA